MRRRGVGFRSLKEALDTTTSGGRLVFHVFAALAEFIRELIVEGTQEGLAAAKARGVRLGRPPAMAPEQVRHARALLAQPDSTVSSIARLLNVSRSTIYTYVPELAPGRLAVEEPTVRSELETGSQFSSSEPTWRLVPRWLNRWSSPSRDDLPPFGMPTSETGPERRPAVTRQG
ncbi:recombinase family protein [Nonomuraea angiospora]